MDSALPLDEALRRFRADLPVTEELTHAARSRGALVRRFARAVERRDTAAVRAMLVSRSEFAYLYYPTSPYTRPPTEQAAALIWFLSTEHSAKGITRVFDRFGGKPLRLVDHSCPSPPRREGGNSVWDGCAVRIAGEGDTVAVRLFGGILEREGRFKFLSYANDL